MVTPRVYSNEENISKDKRPKMVQELSSCNAYGDGDIVQIPLEKLRPSTAGKKKIHNYRDKESLLEELLELKTAIVDQAYHMKLHKQHAGQVQEENKILEKNIENLELAYGLEAPRVGGECKLKAKLLGLKAHLRDKQIICNSQEVEIGLLCKDIRVTHCRELEIERDCFASEVGTLQKTMRGLRRVFMRVNSKNDEIQKVQQKISKLDCTNKELNTNIDSAKKIIGDSKAEIATLSNQSSEARSAAQKANAKLLELERHSLVLAKLKHQEERETMRLEHSILKMGDDAREIFKDKLAAQKMAATQASSEIIQTATKKHKKLPDQGPESPSGDAMAQLEAEFIAEVETAAVEFIETVPASRPPSPKTEDQLKEQHITFESHKDFFTDKVEDAQMKFLHAMEEIEYGKAQSKGSLKAQAAKKLADAEKARREAEQLANKFGEDAKKAQEEATRLQDELDRLTAMGSRDKRWKKEKVSVMMGEVALTKDNYQVNVNDRGAEIDVDVGIRHSCPSVVRSSDQALEDVSDKLATLNNAKAKAEVEATRLDKELRKAQVEQDRLAAELNKLQGMGAGEKRWKLETVSIVMGNKSLAKEDFKMVVLDKGLQIEINVQIQDTSSEIADELVRAKELVGKARNNLLNDDSNNLIETNNEEVLQHLKNTTKVITPSKVGPSKHDLDSGN